MCRLCGYARENAAFRNDMLQSSLRDLDRLTRTKAQTPRNPSVFTNVPGWLALRFDFALFEPLSAFPNPQNYYQPLYVDGGKMRSDWQSGWTRSIAFLPNGNLLLFAKATEREPFDPSSEIFQYLFLVEFSPSELLVEHSPPKFVIRANEVKKEGINLLTNSRVSHTFSFSFSHFAIEKSAMRSGAIGASAFLRQVLRHGKKEEKGEPTPQAPRSDFEKYSITALHYAPHPLLMRGFREMGYENRFTLQLAVPQFLDEHLRKMKSLRAP